MRTSIVRLVVVLALALYVGACGNNPIPVVSGPSDPSPPPSSPPTAPPTFSFVSVSDMGMPSSSLPIYGLRGDNTEQLVRETVFCDPQGGTRINAPNQGSLRGLIRPDGPISVVYDPAVFGDVNQLGSRAARMARAVADNAGYIPFPISLGTVPGAGMNIEVAIVPSLAAERAWASVNPTSNGVITGGRIDFKDLKFVTEYGVAHEIGHLLGGCHHNGRGVMGYWQNSEPPMPSGDAPVYTQHERDNFALMAQLTPGVTFPSVSGAAPFSSHLRVGGTSATIVMVD